ncbi:MAG: HD domain-containing protein [Sandaracinaceae bacterium]|nr:HD domain-containing protein [Sandaracinaceae bacterium]
MILRDPVHGLVAFEGQAERVIAALLEAREVQRLRRVRQLGLTSLVFPGAEHSRFAHALGAAHLMNRLLQRIAMVSDELPVDQRVDEEAQRDALAAALLHDLGHGPFSHLFEEVLPGARHHEEWTCDAILDSGTDVHRTLKSIDAGMPERVVALLNGTHRLTYLSRAVSGTLDVDRSDYLLRDSHMTGVRYGLFDLEWLTRALAFGYVPHEKGGEWVLAIEGRKGLPPIEGFFLGRNAMYQQVYHHKATRAAEALIRGVFLRLGELVREGRAPEQTPDALARAARGEAISLGSYLDLDDSVLLHCFSIWSKSNDPTLADGANRLMVRKLPKTIPLPEDEGARPLWNEALARAKHVVNSLGMRADLTVFLDEPTEMPYSEPGDDSAEGMWVILRHQPIRRLSDVSFLLGQLRNARVVRPRLIFPAEARADVVRAVEEVIR